MKDPSLSHFCSSLDLRPDDVEKLKIYEALLLRWSRVKNLVSQRSLTELWPRHIFDSAQVQRALPRANTWVDLGSGAGFPGLVTAILLGERGHVHLVESDHRKCAFLRDVSRETGSNTSVHCARIEECATDIGQVDAVSARALADMEQLVEWAKPFIDRGATCVFPKGKGVADELTRLGTERIYDIRLSPSISHADGSLVILKGQPRPASE